MKLVLEIIVELDLIILFCPYHPIEDIKRRENDIEYGKK